MVLRNAGQYLYEKIYTERNKFIEKSVGGIIAASFLAGMAFPQVLEILFQENTSYATFVIQIIILVFIIIYVRNLRSDRKGIEKQEGKNKK
jgi:O-antigen/teichoic acid export membrane protein